MMIFASYTNNISIFIKRHFILLEYMCRFIRNQQSDIDIYHIQRHHTPEVHRNQNFIYNFSPFETVKINESLRNIIFNFCG